MGESERADLLEDFARYEQTRRQAQAEDLEILVRAYPRLPPESRSELWHLLLDALLRTRAATIYETPSPSDEQVRELERELTRESMPRLPDFIEDARGCGHFVDSIEERLGESVLRSSDGFGWSESPQIIEDYRNLCREHHHLMSIESLLDTESPAETEIRVADLIHDFQIQWRRNLFERLITNASDWKSA